MNRLRFPTLIILGIAALVIFGASMMAQQTRISPHETISLTVDGNRITVVYGRPYSKDSKTGDIRKIWGGLVPYDKVWRTGADEATLLITQLPIMIGEATIPPGAYTLYTLPSESGTSKLIINKQLGQWGLTYDEKQDLVRVDLKKEALDKPVDQFTTAITRNQSGGGGVLKMMWENTQFSVAFTTVKK
jgi:hypothetical protein